jgi:benzylsuccinate CoA-transferase BbsF subunit
VTEALSHIRVCDFGGQLAGAGATKFLAAFGAQVIRVEDPVTRGRWDLLRGVPPFVDDRRGVDLGGGFNNHNAGKLGITINLRTDAGRDLARELIAASDVVCENFAPGVLARWGLDYEQLRKVRSDVVYVSNCGFGHSGPYRDFKTWGPIVQAVSGLTFTSGLPDQEPAGWGYSYMDHVASYYMAIAILAALHHRERTGEGQWVDLATVPAGVAMLPTEVLDWSVNGRPTRRSGQPSGNRADYDEMAPHGIYAAAGKDRWVAVACRDDTDWKALTAVVAEPWTDDQRYADVAGRIGAQDELDAHLAAHAAERDADELAAALVGAGVPASVVRRPDERIDGDPDLASWGLFPSVTHSQMGAVRVEGLPVRFSETDWSMTDGAPCLGEHTDQVLREVLGKSDDDIARLREDGVL